MGALNVRFNAPGAILKPARRRLFLKVFPEEPLGFFRRHFPSPEVPGAQIARRWLARAGESEALRLRRVVKRVRGPIAIVIDGLRKAFFGGTT